MRRSSAFRIAGFTFLLTVLAAAFIAFISSDTAKIPVLKRVTLNPPPVVENQRYADVAGNYYNQSYIESFSYAQPSSVEVVYYDKNSTFRGKLYAKKLKPFFTYQVKLVGLHSDMTAMERIGYAGRWLISGGGTNFSDTDYQMLADKTKAEGYILFDWFTTDSNGDAQLEFALDSSYHVIVSANLEDSPPPEGERTEVVFVNRFSPPAYDRFHEPKIARIWAMSENRWSGYRPPAGKTRLTTGHYNCIIRLTEECFHGVRGGGYWATALEGKVSFEIVE